MEFFRQATGAAGVMLARAAMWNPAIFAPSPADGPPPCSAKLVQEYLQLVGVCYQAYLWFVEYIRLK